MVPELFSSLFWFKLILISVAVYGATQLWINGSGIRVKLITASLWACQLSWVISLG